MVELIIEQIEKRARTEHDGDFNKAAAEYFRDHPEEWQRYKDDVTVMNKRAGDDPRAINAEVQFQAAMIARRDKLDLDKPADRVTALEKMVAEHPGLYRRYQLAASVRIGKSLPD